MSEHKSPARASGSNPPPAIIAGLEHTECDGTPLSAMGSLLDKIAILESRVYALEALNIQGQVNYIRNRLNEVDVKPAAIMPELSEVVMLDRLVELHERIEITYNVDHYEASLLTSERQAMVGIGGTIQEAMTSLCMNTLDWTIEDVRTCGGKN